MEGNISENLEVTVKILMKEVKSQASKISELEKNYVIVGKLLEKIKRVDKDLKDEKNETDKRFDNVIENFESCNNTIVDHIDSIDEKEIKLCKVTTEMTMVNDAIKKFDDEIKEIEKRHGNEEPANQNEVKQCRFDKYGFCREGMEKCNFFHSPDTCGPYLEKGYCNKLVCRKRHPKRCIYFDQGYCKRNNECRYLHKSQVVNKCKKCAQVSNTTYFCEFCNESFCGQCIVEEAHIHKSDKLMGGCESIHH